MHLDILNKVDPGFELFEYSEDVPASAFFWFFAFFREVAVSQFISKYGHTIAATIISFVIFIPLIFVTGLFALFAWTGSSGDAPTFFDRLLQYLAASGFAVYAPHLLLRKSHPRIVQMLFVATSIVVAGYALWRSQNDGWQVLLEIVASQAGMIIGAGIGSKMAADKIAQLERERAQKSE